MHKMQKLIFVFLVCAVASISGQFMAPFQSWNMSPGNLASSMGRYPGWMQTSHVSSMGYPTWKSHPLFRVATTASTDKNLGVNLPQDVLNVPKVPSAQEVLTHMALANQNPKPYYDTMADLMYDPQKTRHAVVPPVYLQGMNVMRSMISDDCGPQDSNRWERGMNEWVY